MATHQHQPAPVRAPHATDSKFRPEQLALVTDTHTFMLASMTSSLGKTGFCIIDRLQLRRLWNAAKINKVIYRALQDAMPADVSPDNLKVMNMGEFTYIFDVSKMEDFSSLTEVARHGAKDSVPDAAK